jgi:hypothetical protein
MPYIETTEQRGIKPKEALADTICGGDDNHEAAQQKGVNLIAPTQDKQKNLACLRYNEKNVRLIRRRAFSIRFFVGLLDFSVLFDNNNYNKLTDKTNKEVPHVKSCRTPKK